MKRLLILLLGLSSLAAMPPAYGKSTEVSSVSTTVSPSQPRPDDLYTVSTILRGTTGTPCRSVSVTATVAGQAQTQSNIQIHANQPASLRFSFSLAGVASGTDLTPTISWSGCGGGSSSAIAGGTTPPTVATTPTPALDIVKSLSGAGKTIVSPGDLVTYRIEYTSSGSATATGVSLTDNLDSRLAFVSATGGGTHSAGTVTWNLGDLDPGDSNTVEVTSRVVASATSGDIVNTARIQGDSLGPFNSNPVTVSVDTQPNIRLTKTIFDDTTQAAVLEAGRVVTYRIKYENLGGGDATNVVITDVLPSQLTGTPVLGGGVSSAYDPATRTATWNVGTVARKNDGVVTLTAQIDPALGVTDFENEARATFSGGASNLAAAHITVQSEPYLQLLKTVQPTLAAPGQSLTYSIAYANIGSLAARNPVIRDQLPTGLSPVPGTYTGTYDPATRTLEWNLPDLAPGAQTHSLSYQATIDGGLTNTDLVNQVTASADNLPGVLTATASAKVQVRQEPVLVPVKRLSAGTRPLVLDGDRLVFEIAVANTGQERTDGGITITDSLPPGLTFVSASAGGTETTAGVVTWNLADLAPTSSTGTLSLEVEVDGALLADGDFIANAIEVTAQDPFGRQYRETSNHAVVQYNAPPDVAITKTATPPESTPLVPGDVVDYTITATLQSRQGVSDLQIVDFLPPQLEFIKASDPAVAVVANPSGTQVTWPAAALSSGSRSVTLQARVRGGLTAGESVINLAGATFGAGSGFSSPALVQHFLSDAAVRIGKSIAPDQAEVVDGEEIDYQIDYSNTGKVTLTGIKLQDTLPDGVVLVSASPAVTSTTTGPPTVLRWDLPDLAPGKGNTVSVKVRVNGASPGTVLRNQAQIETNESQPSTTPPVVSTVREAPLLVLGKTASANTLHPGDTVEFTVTYENQGRGAAQNVVLTDTFPGGLTFVSASDQVTPVAGKISWNLGTLAPGAGASKTVRARVPAGSYVPAVDFTNRADIVSDKTAATASVTVTVTELPHFTLTKAVDRSHASPGDTLHYTLTLDKTGGPATNVSVGDLLSPNTRFVAGSASTALAGSSDISAGLLFWNLGNLPDGPASATITFSAAIDPVLANGTALNNRAAVAATEINAILSNEATTIVDSAPVLTISKTASTGTLFSPTTASGSSGDTIVYTLTATNTGNAVASGVTITDTLPRELVIDPTSTTASISGQTATWTVPTLPPGTPATFTVSARVANDVADGTRLRNSASIQTGMPGVGGAVSNEVVAVVQGQAQLSLTKRASVSSVKAGQQLSYTLDYSNTGTATSGPITIEDLIPPETSFVKASDGGTDSGNGHVTWTLPALPAGQGGSVTLTLAADGVVVNGTRLRNVARIWEGSNTTSATPAQIIGKPAIVSSRPVLEIDKTADTGGTVTAGGKALFDIAYRNTGSDAATNVVITDVLPPGMTLVSATGSPSVSGNKLTWSLAGLAAQTSGNFKVTARADSALSDGKVLTNSASISATEQPLPIGDTASVTVQNAVLALHKAVSKTSARSGISATGAPGEQVTYTLSYSNNGNATANGTVLRDVLPADVVFVSATPAPASVSGRTISWNLGSVPASTGGQVILVTRVADDLREGTLLHNTAAISSATTPSTAAAPVDTVVTSQPVLVVDKTSTVTQVTPGQTYAYDITLRNEGSDTARNVVITDVLPAETTFVSASGGGVHSAGNVTWDIEALHGPLAANTSVTLHLEVRADSVIANGTPLLNIASASGETSSGALLPGPKSTLLLPVSSSPVLTIDYAVDQLTVAPGGALLYTLTVRNTGNAIAENVTVSASLPPDTLPQSIDSFGKFVGNTATWTIGSLPPSGSIVLRFSVFVNTGIGDGTAEGSVASIQGSNAPTSSASALSFIGARADLTVDKFAPNSVNAGDSMTYAIDYFNAGNAVATGTTIEDSLPAGTSFVSASNGGVEVTPGVVRWDLGSVAPLAGGRVTVTVDTAAGVNSGTVIDNTASITATGIGARVARASTVERSHTELEVTITANQDPVAAGGQETFTVTWANTGNQDTSNALVTATLPPDTSFASAKGGGSFNGTNLVTWSVGNLPAGSSGSASFTVDVMTGLLNGTVLKSVASITAADGLPDSRSAPFMVSSTPIWLVSKSADTATIDAGGEVSFTITLQNLGNEAATGVVITDNLPAGLKLLAADNGGVVDAGNNTVTWNIGSVAIGAAPLTLTVRARMVAANTTVTNVAILASNELPAVSVNANVRAGVAQPIPAIHWMALLALMLMMGALGARPLRAGAPPRQG